MSREILKDFKTLVEFVNQYNLRSLTDNSDFIKILSQQHKRFYSYLSCIAEIVSLSKKESLTPTISEKQIDFITESCSDIGSAFFVMINGAYKASRMMLRSSIETFWKGYTLDWVTNIDQEKSVYSIFEQIKALPFF